MLPDNERLLLDLRDKANTLTAEWEAAAPGFLKPYRDFVAACAEQVVERLSYLTAWAAETNGASFPPAVHFDDRTKPEALPQAATTFTIPDVELREHLDGAFLAQSFGILDDLRAVLCEQFHTAETAAKVLAEVERAVGLLIQLPQTLRRQIVFKLDGKTTGQKARQKARQKSPPKRRGRPSDTDKAADRRLWDAWQTGNHEDKAALAEAFGISLEALKLALDRERHRRKPQNRKRRPKAAE